MNHKLKIATGLIFFGLLVTLIYKLTLVPGGMILSGLFLGGMVIVMILVGGLLLVWLAKLFTNRKFFWPIYFTLTAIAFIIFHYQIYSPTIKIEVPENYTGQVSLIKSKMTANILKIDTNGIGYLNEWTFSKLHSKPRVIDRSGKDLSNQIVGYNHSSFYALGTSTIPGSHKEIVSLSFEIVPKDRLGEKQDYQRNLSKLVDQERIK